MTKKMQQNIIFMVLIMGGLVYAHFNYLIKPLESKHAEALQKLQKTETRLNEMKKRSLELPKLQAEMKLLELEVTSLERLLPKDREIPTLLRTFTKTAQKYHMRINNLVPGGVNAQGDFNEIPFQVTMTGTYHGLAYFLADLGQEQRIISAGNLVFSAQQVSKENPSTISVVFKLYAYTFKS